MLSLKSTAIYQTAPSKINLLDLPAELIGTILDQLPLLDDLLSASLVSKRLREETLSILFYSINLTFTTNFRRHGKTILDYLLANPSLSRHVREVNIRKPVGAVTADLYEVAKLDRLSSQLQSLHTIKLCSWDGNVSDMLAKPWVKTKGIRLRISELSPRSIHALFCQDMCQNLDDISPESLYFCFTHPSDDPNTLGPTSMISTIVGFSSLRSLNLVVETRIPTTMFRYLPTNHDIVRTSPFMPSLQELHLELPMRSFEELDESMKPLFMRIPWDQLRRLSLTGNKLIEVVLSQFSNSLKTLGCLHLRAIDRWQLKSDRVQSYAMNRTQRSQQIWCTPLKGMSRIRNLIEFLECKELVLEGFSATSLPLRDILSTELRSLRVHICELNASQHHHNVRQASDLRCLPALAPNIERLELDVARIGNLWHSTAVPGVDVDVRIYQIFDAITSLPRLRHLRLFPQYFVKNRDYGTFEQPLTDDVAVHLFRRLKEKSASLQILEISSDNRVAQNAGDFNPMSWRLCAHCDKIILTVRQANHDYEQRQVWAGERRLTTEIRRYSYEKPYVPEFEGWLMER